MNEQDRDLTGGSSQPLTEPGTADEVAAAYESVASEPVSPVSEVKPKGTTAATPMDGLQQAALATLLQRRAIAGMVYKQLWVILCALMLVLLGVTFVPWSGLEDQNVNILAANAQAEAAKWAEAEGNADAAYYYPLTFAAEVKKTHAPGYTQGRGAIILFFTFWAMGATFLGIMTNRFLLMPTAAAFLMGLFVAVTRLMVFLKADGVMDVVSQGFADHKADGLGIASDIFGPGFFFVVIGCLFIPIYLVFSAVSGAKDSKKAKGSGSRAGAKGGKGGKSKAKSSSTSRGAKAKR